MCVGASAFASLTRFELSGLASLAAVSVEMGGCSNVQEVALTKLPRLRRVVFDSGSFVRAHSCAFADAPLLESVVIGDKCFEKAGTFVVERVPSLKSLVIHSDAFTLCEELRLCHLEAIETISIGDYAFHSIEILLVESLPKLKKLFFGEDCCCGSGKEGFELVLKWKSDEIGGVLGIDLTELESLTVSEGCLQHCTNAVIEGLPKVREEELHIGKNCFGMATCVIKKDGVAPCIVSVFNGLSNGCSIILL